MEKFTMEGTDECHHVQNRANSKVRAGYAGSSQVLKNFRGGDFVTFWASCSCAHVQMEFSLLQPLTAASSSFCGHL